MILKARSESEELLVLRSLNTRMELTDKEKFHYTNLEKGYEGDCYLESDKFFSVTTGREYKNPVLQLKRRTTRFRQLLQKFKLNYLVEPFVIFINPEFTLYQAPTDQPIIFPTQVHRFLNDLSKTPSKLNEGHSKLAQKLSSCHQTKNPFRVLPHYNYDQLQKGIYCKTCKSFHISKKNIYFVCGKCGDQEKIELAILRNVKEFKLLFPERTITTQSIFDWCNVDLHRKTIRRVLMKHYTPIGNTSDTYYE